MFTKHVNFLIFINESHINRVHGWKLTITSNTVRGFFHILAKVRVKNLLCIFMKLLLHTICNLCIFYITLGYEIFSFHPALYKVLPLAVSGKNNVYTEFDSVFSNQVKHQTMEAPMSYVWLGLSRHIDKMASPPPLHVNDKMLILPSPPSVTSQDSSGNCHVSRQKSLSCRSLR